MRLCNLRCDGCGRMPNLVEWFKGEFTMQGYPDWRHPGLAFKEAGLAMTYENRKRCARIFQALFMRPMPDEMGYLCPQCQARVHAELPALVVADYDYEQRQNLPPRFGHPYAQ